MGILKQDSKAFPSGKEKYFRSEFKLTGQRCLSFLLNGNANWRRLETLSEDLSHAGQCLTLYTSMAWTQSGSCACLSTRAR